MALQMETGGWQPQFELSALRSGEKYALAKDQEEEELLKSQLANFLSQQKAPNEIIESNLTGLRNSGLSTPDMVQAYLDSQRGDFDSKAVKGRTDVALEESDIASKRTKNLLDAMQNKNMGVYQTEVGKTLDGLPADGTIGFPTSKAPQTSNSMYGQETRGKGLPPGLVDAIIQVESSGNPNAYNPASGATGLGQFIPSTAKAMEKFIPGFNPKDPAQSRQAIEIYMGQLLNKHGGDLDKALAAYGGFVTKDPSSYISKIKRGMGADTEVAPQPTPKTRLDMVRETVGNTPAHWAAMDLERLKGEKARATALASGDATNKRLFGQEKIKAMGEMRQYDVAISSIDKEIAKMRSKEYMNTEIANIIAQERVPESQAMKIAQERVQAQIAEYESNKEQFRTMRDFYADTYQLPKSISMPSKPQGSSAGLQQQVEKAGVQYEPNKYEYRIGPNGEVQRKAKG